MKYTLFLSILFVCIALLSTMKRKKVDNCNENRKLKRRVAALPQEGTSNWKGRICKIDACKRQEKQFTPEQIQEINQGKVSIVYIFLLIFQKP